MREILFRAKKKDDGEWMVGFPIRLFEYGGDAWVMSPFNTMFEVNELVVPKTIGQYTGLKDKNGKKIFEGDIMNSAGNVVEFCNGSFCINGDSDLAFWTNTEIIGNIYDNPELSI